MFVLYHLFYFIVNVKLRVTEMNKCFIFFINIISVQVNQSALLNVLKIITVSCELCNNELHHSRPLRQKLFSDFDL